MRKIFTLFCVVLTTIFSAQADNATFSWSLKGGNTAADRSADVVVDANGNVFTANYFANTTKFNGVALTGSPANKDGNYDNNLFVSKISPAQTTLWHIYSNVGVVTPMAITTTPSGDLIVTGTIRDLAKGTAGNANIIDAAGTITSFTGLNNSSVQSFVAKFNASGIIQWVKEFNSSATKDKAVTTNALAADANGDVYLTGIYTTSVILPAAIPITLTSTNTTQAAFIAKLNGSTGDNIWSKTSTGLIASEILQGLAYGDDGYLYAAGDYKNVTTPIAITIGGKTFTPSVGADLTLIKLDTDGNIIYIQERPSVTGTTIRDVRVKDIAVKSGKVFVGGSFYGDFGGILFSDAALTSSSSYLNGFLATFNSSTGSDLWHKGIFSPAIAEVDGLTIGNDNNLFAFGYYYNKIGTAAAGDADFGNGFKLTDASNNSGDLFLSSYNVTTGVTLGVHLVGKGATFETANSLTSFGSNLYLLGSSNSATLTFEDASTYSTVGGYDFFLVDYTVVNPSTGIISSEASKLPFSYVDHANHLVVVKNAGDIKSAKIIDTTGRIIKTTSNNNNDVININAQGITSGVYILQLTASNSQITSQRLIIQ